MRSPERDADEQPPPCACCRHVSYFRDGSLTRPVLNDKDPQIFTDICRSESHKRARDTLAPSKCMQRFESRGRGFSERVSAQPPFHATPLDHWRRPLLHQTQEDPNKDDEHDEHLDDDTAVSAHYLVVPARSKQGEPAHGAHNGDSEAVFLYVRPARRSTRPLPRTNAVHV